MTRPLAIALLILAAIGAAYLTGRHQEKVAFQGRLDAAQVRADAAANEASKALAVAEQRQRQLSQQLEDAANAEPISNPACLPRSRVLRLNAH